MTASPIRRVFVSLGLRVTVPIVLLVVTVAVGVYWGLVRQARARLFDSKEAAAEMVVKLTSVSVLPAVVFGDGQEMQRAVDNLARNPDVSDVELWGYEASALGGTEGLLARFHRDGARPLGRPAETTSRRWRDGGAIRLIEPVVNLEGKPVAALTVRFSTAREAATLSELSRRIMWVSGGTALALALAILFAIHRVVVRPVKRLELAAGRLARGEAHDLLRERTAVEDEVVRLADKFSEMAEAVRDREQRLALRSAELKLILDSVEQGFLTAGSDGKLFAERSAIVGKWVGPLSADATLWSLVAAIDPSLESWTRTAWDQITADLLPLEVAIDQLPKRVSRPGQSFSLAYHPVLVDGRLERVVVVMTDITAELERQRALAEQHEFATLVDQFVRDRRAFHAFWQEASRLVSRITSAGGSEALRRDVHTLKGNTRFFGLTRVSSLCHELESAMSERREATLLERERASLRELWESLQERIEPLMRGATTFLEVSSEEYQRLLEAVRRREPPEHVEELVVALRHEPMSIRLEQAKRQLELSLRKLDKAPPQIEIHHDGLRVPPAPWAPFWTIFCHVLSNAVDHGLEGDDERRAAGKPVPGRLWLSTRMVDSEVVVEVRDDGRGIDWESVRGLAHERGLPTSSQRDLEQALFVEGVSLSASVSETSGRGVGLSAVRGVVSAMGGRIEVESMAGAGTAWRFRFPGYAFAGKSSERPPAPGERERSVSVG